MKLSDTDLERCDREWAARVLREDEELLLAYKPKSDAVNGEILQPTFMGLVFMAVPSYGVLYAGVPCTWENVLILSIFILSGMGFVFFPWRKRSLKKRSMCLVTNRRVIHLSLSLIRKSELIASYELRPNVQLDVVEEQKDGTGCLAFNYANEEESLEYGGLLDNVPQVRHVAAVLQTALKEQQS